MKLSIIIPTKNEEDFLPKLLTSIQFQSLQPYEIIIADAQSTDATRKIAKEFGAKIVDGGMPGIGRNAGAEVVKGDLLLFLDADVVLGDKGFLKRMIKEFVKSDFDIATADIKPLKGGVLDRLGHQLYNYYVRLIGSWKPHAPGFFILVKKSLHKKINGFDEGIVFCEDHDYAMRAGKLGKFGFLNHVKIDVSTRRMNRDGYFNLAIKFILAELHLWFFGPIKHHKFNYTFGHKKNSHAKRKNKKRE